MLENDPSSTELKRLRNENRALRQRLHQAEDSWPSEAHEVMFWSRRLSIMKHGPVSGDLATVLGELRRALGALDEETLRRARARVHGFDNSDAWF